jgi:hypothetical protein
MTEKEYDIHLRNSIPAGMTDYVTSALGRKVATMINPNLPDLPWGFFYNNQVVAAVHDIIASWIEMHDPTRTEESISLSSSYFSKAKMELHKNIPRETIVESLQFVARHSNYETVAYITNQKPNWPYADYVLPLSKEIVDNYLGRETKTQSDVTILRHHSGKFSPGPPIQKLCKPGS